jgi:hypothetical protein
MPGWEPDDLPGWQQDAVRQMPADARSWQVWIWPRQGGKATWLPDGRLLGELRAALTEAGEMPSLSFGFGPARPWHARARDWLAGWLRAAAEWIGQDGTER